MAGEIPADKAGIDNDQRDHDCEKQQFKVCRSPVAGRQIPIGNLCCQQQILVLDLPAGRIYFFSVQHGNAAESILQHCGIIAGSTSIHADKTLFCMIENRAVQCADGEDRTGIAGIEAAECIAQRIEPVQLILLCREVTAVEQYAAVIERCRIVSLTVNGNRLLVTGKRLHLCRMILHEGAAGSLHCSIRIQQAVLLDGPLPAQFIQARQILRMVLHIPGNGISPACGRGIKGSQILRFLRFIFTDLLLCKRQLIPEIRCLLLQIGTQFQLIQHCSQNQHAHCKNQHFNQKMPDPLRFIHDCPPFGENKLNENSSSV